MPLPAMVRGGLKRRFRRRVALAAAATALLVIAAAAGVAGHDLGAHRTPMPATTPTPVPALTARPPVTIHSEHVNNETWDLKVQVVAPRKGLDAGNGSSRYYELKVWLEVDGEAERAPVRIPLGPDVTGSTVEIWTYSDSFHVGVVGSNLTRVVIHGEDNQPFDADLLSAYNLPVRFFVLNSPQSWLRTACVHTYVKKGAPRAKVNSDPLKRCGS